MKKFISTLLLTGLIATTLPAMAVCPCKMAQPQHQTVQAKPYQAVAQPSPSCVQNCPTCKKYYKAGAMGTPYTPQPCAVPCPCPESACPCPKPCPCS